MELYGIEKLDLKGGTMRLPSLISRLLSILITFPEREHPEENLDYLIVNDRFQRNILEKIGKLEELEKGNIKCHSCSKIITESNLRMIIPRDEVTSDLICDSLNCYDRYLRNFGS